MWWGGRGGMAVEGVLSGVMTYPTRAGAYRSEVGLYVGVGS